MKRLKQRLLEWMVRFVEKRAVLWRIRVGFNTRLGRCTYDARAIIPRDGEWHEYTYTLVSKIKDSVKKKQTMYMDGVVVTKEQ